MLVVVMPVLYVPWVLSREPVVMEEADEDWGALWPQIVIVGISVRRIRINVCGGGGGSGGGGVLGHSIKHWCRCGGV
jgi:hypothetical protein